VCETVCSADSSVLVGTTDQSRHYSASLRVCYDVDTEGLVVLLTRLVEGLRPTHDTLELELAHAVRTPLIATSDPDEFAASPIGRCLVRPTFAIWCAAPDLHGSILWGSLDERSIREMMSVGSFIHHPDMAARRRGLTDLRDVEHADANVLLGFASSAREQVDGWTMGLERQVLIVPPGLGGMMMSGALPLAGIEHPLKIAHDLEAALAFVDHPVARSAYAAAAAIVRATRGRSALIDRVRAQLRADLDGATIESCASGLGMSRRTLQRELQSLATSFSDELRKLRIATAEALLAHTDIKIDAIAVQVGFGTASRMSAMLRRERNRTASELRAERQSSTKIAAR
jgi:AraC-like DNA-binding protein